MKKNLLKTILILYVASAAGTLRLEAGVENTYVGSIQKDCECDGGIPFMTVQYKGTDGATVNVYAGKDRKNLIATIRNVSNNDLLSIDGSKYMHGSHKNKRYFEIEKSNTSQVIFTTSCSEAILGQTKGNFTVIGFIDSKGRSCSQESSPTPGNPSVPGIPATPEPSSPEVNPPGHSDNIVPDGGSSSEPSNSFGATISVGNVTCFGYSDGSISLNAYGGKAPYSYLWSNGSTSQSISGLTAGWYSVTVRDAANLEKTLKAEVSEECTMGISYILKPNTCYGENDGAIDLTVVGGKAPYTFAWSHGPATEDVSGLSIGTYQVIVTDHNGCSMKESFTLTEKEPFVASIGKDYCNSKSLEADASGGTAPYSYFWSNGATTREISNLDNGTYTVIITDALGCSVSATETISGNHLPLHVTAGITRPNCKNDMGGAVDISVTGGVSPYSFFWSNGATTEDVTGLMAGSYSVTVSDANGCFEMLNFNITSTSSMAIYINKYSRISCFGNEDGELGVIVTGGVAPYTFLWSNGATTSDIDNLSPGEYEVEATDANGCKTTSTFVVEEPQTLAVDITNQHCMDGTIDLTVTGGTKPYYFRWSTGDTTEDLKGVEPGEYSVLITDGRGCMVEKDIEIVEVFDPIVLDLKTVNPGCEQSTGAATVNVTGGLAPYTYEWSTGQTVSSVTGLQPGTHSVKVTDKNKCFKTVNFTISVPEAIKINTSTLANVSCYGENNGQIALNVEGGSAPYSYEWSTGDKTSAITGLEAGLYTVIVTDAKGCSNQRNFYIIEPQEFEAEILASFCNNPILDLIVYGGTKPYSYLWSNGATTEDLTSFSEGTYSVEITDVMGCKTFTSIEVPKSSTMNLKFTTESSGCKCGANGKIELNVEGGKAPYSYLWSNGQTVKDLVGVSAGEYSVKVTDATGCIQSGSVEIGESTALAVELVKNTNESCLGNDGALQIKISGGSAPYSYSWNNGGTTSTISGLIAGTYHLKIVDAAGCSTDASFKVEKSPCTSVPLSARIESCENQVICTGETAAINVMFTGTGSWNFKYSDGTTTKSVSTTSNPYVLQVDPMKLTTYKLVEVSNTSGTGTVTGSVTIGVNDCSSGGKGKSCATNCFDTKILSVKDNGNCATITMEVHAGTNCSSALSHFSVAVPCGTISKVTNSRGWPVEIGNTDPTTGIQGFKVDDIKNFGENGKAGSFIVTYTVCNTGSCGEQLPTCEPIVAYKAGQCVNYDIAEFGVGREEKGVISAYPNPSEDGIMTIILKDLNGADVTLTLKDMAGIQYYHKVLPLEHGTASVTLDMLKSFPKGIYILTAASKDKVYHQRIMIN